MHFIRMLTILAVLPWMAASQVREERTPSLEQLASQLRATQAEVLELRLEIQTAKIARLQMQVAATRDARKKLEEGDRFAREELAALDQRLGSRDLTVEQRMETEIDRNEVLDNSLRRIHPQRLEAERKEMESARELQIATAKLDAIRAQSKQHQ
jgi:hypothetical protein